MSLELANLPNDPAQLKATIAEQQHSLTTLQSEIVRLKFLLAKLTRQQYGRKSEQLDATQQLLFELTGEQPAPEPTREIAVPPRPRRGGGRLTIPKHLDRQIVDHELPAAEQNCPCCGEQRSRIGFEKSEQLEVIPSQLFVLEHRRWKYACRKCEEQVAIAPAPPKPLAKGLAGPGLLAAIGVGKFSEHLPLYRLEDLLFRQGATLPRSTLCRWVIEGAQLLRPLVELLKRGLLQSQAIHTDDTPVKVLDRQLPQTRTGRFWVYCGDRLHPFTVYDYTATRERAGPREFLGDYAGYLHADAYGGYEELYALGKIQQVSCWAHARRKFFEAQAAAPEALVALGYLRRLYAVEHQLAELSYRITTRTELEAATRKWYRARRDARQRESLPILHEFCQWLRSLHLLPKSPLNEARQYVLSRWESFTRYCEKGFLDIDNNLAERMVRPVAIGRKNYLFLGADRGGVAAAIWYSLIATAKQNQLEPWAWCQALITRLAELGPNPTAADLTPLLPQNWLEANPQARREWSR